MKMLRGCGNSTTSVYDEYTDDNTIFLIAILIIVLISLCLIIFFLFCRMGTYSVYGEYNVVEENPKDDFVRVPLKIDRKTDYGSNE